MRPENLPSTFVNILCCRQEFHQLLSTFCDTGSLSVNFRPRSIWPGELPLTSINFCATGRPFVNFHKLPVQPIELPLISVIFLYSQENLRQLSLGPGDLPLTPVIFLCNSGTFRELPSNSMWEAFWQLPSIFRADGRASGNVRQISVRPVDLPSSFINFPCSHGTFCQILSTYHGIEELSSTFLNFPSAHRSFRQISMRLQSIVATYISNSCRQKNFLQLLSNFCAATRPSVNFRKLSVQRRGLLSSSVNFPYYLANFVNFRQLEVRLGDLLSTSVNLPCSR